MAKITVINPRIRKVIPNPILASLCRNSIISMAVVSKESTNLTEKKSIERKISMNASMVSGRSADSVDSPDFIRFTPKFEDMNNPIRRMVENARGPTVKPSILFSGK
jgi:hypothetical protein